MSKAILAVYQNPSFALVQLAALAVAFWPVWRWYCERLFDRSDEPLGIVALITVLVLAGWRRIQASKQERLKNLAISVLEDTRPKTMLMSGLILAYCIVLPVAPLMVSALFAMAIIGICLCQTNASDRPTFGDWALLLLSLPMVASLNFYLGYPMRILACHLASAMLNLGGLAVSAQGTEILSNNSIVGIDPPCSGIKMLWVAMYLTSTFASVRGLKTAPTLKLLLLSVLAAIVANALRVSSLFYVESGIIDVGTRWHSFVHSGVGVAVFALSAAVLMKVTYSVPDSELAQAAPREPQPPSQPAKHVPILIGSFMLLCGLAASIPFVYAPEPARESEERFTGWPTEFEEQKLQQVQLSELTNRFAEDFPGKIAVYTTGKRRIVYRWVTQATRQLHPASNCYKASGYEIKWLPEHVDASNNKWAAFEAARGSEKLLVRERLFDQSGHSWTDVSSWYWSAVLKQSSSPWWSVSVAERAE